MESAQAPWESLPVAVTSKDVVSVYLSPEEVTVISEYGSQMFDKETIDRFPSQWASSRGANKRNPNTTGIKGEWAGIKYFSPQTTLQEFLVDRPWKMADMGDAIIKGKIPKIFDYKTRTRKAPVEELVSDDTWMAEMDNKFSDRIKYGYLQAFIFCVNDEPNNIVHLMGWVTAEEFFRYAELLPAGNPVPHFHWNYVTNTLLLPYRRLHKMKTLKKCSYQAISQNLTIAMRQDWNAKQLLDVKKYIPASL